MPRHASTCPGGELTRTIRGISVSLDTLSVLLADVAHFAGLADAGSLAGLVGQPLAAGHTRTTQFGRPAPDRFTGPRRAGCPEKELSMADWKNWAGNVAGPPGAA